MILLTSLDLDAFALGHVYLYIQALLSLLKLPYVNLPPFVS